LSLNRPKRDSIWHAIEVVEGNRAIRAVLISMTDDTEPCLAIPNRSLNWLVKSSHFA